jgi:hypothetical protein
MVTPPKWIGWCCIVILCIGSLQFIGYLLESYALRGIGAACGFAPYTKVFSDVDGFETFAADFTLILHHEDGTETAVPVTPEFYQQLKGPYNRRNVYGAALSYAPRLPEAMWQSVFCYGFNGPLREEFHISDDVRSISMMISTRTAGRDDSWTFQPPCLD